MNDLFVAVLGSGGREHALALKIAQSPHCKHVFVIPGNAGIHGQKISYKSLDLHDHEKLATALRELKVDLVVVGPDDLLGAGIVDVLEQHGLCVFGPTRAATKLEASKAFAKQIMQKVGVPTARSEILNSADEKSLEKAVQALGGYPIVLKYDGLALGKGVQVCESPIQALRFLQDVFIQKRFSSSYNPTALVEEKLLGREVSLFAITDGKAWALLEPVCDHKQLLEGGRGPNTGGMGAYSPVAWLPMHQAQSIAEQIFPKILNEMNLQGTPFKGLLYAGLMVFGENFWVLEFNARFGDPETQSLMPRLNSDLLPLLYGAATSKLNSYLKTFPLQWSSQWCVNIVATSEGYPEKPNIGHELTLHPTLDPIYFAGVTSKDGKLVTSGGRVFSVSCLGETLEEARKKALLSLEKNHFSKMHFRKDIGIIS